LIDLRLIFKRLSTQDQTFAILIAATLFGGVMFILFRGPSVDEASIPTLPNPSVNEMNPQMEIPNDIIHDGFLTIEYVATLSFAALVTRWAFQALAPAIERFFQSRKFKTSIAPYGLAGKPNTFGCYYQFKRTIVADEVFRYIKDQKTPLLGGSNNFYQRFLVHIWSNFVSRMDYDSNLQGLEKGKSAILSLGKMIVKDRTFVSINTKRYLRGVV
jgi:hypothetical protein